MAAVDQEAVGHVALAPYSCVQDIPSTGYTTPFPLPDPREWQMWIKKLWDTWPEPTNKAKLLSRVLEKLPPRLHRWAVD